MYYVYIIIFCKGNINTHINFESILSIRSEEVLLYIYFGGGGSFTSETQNRMEINL